MHIFEVGYHAHSKIPSRQDQSKLGLTIITLLTTSCSISNLEELGD